MSEAENQINNMMPTNLTGRLRNTSLPKTSALLPLFEAVVNSIHATEDAKLAMEDAHINIEILRKPKQERLNFDNHQEGSVSIEDIIGFKITDNGVGFNDENMRSFKTLDTDYKAEKGGRGIGRLLWLKAFKKVLVNSVFITGNQENHLRTFEFNSLNGVSDEKDEVLEKSENSTTTVHLDGFISIYRNSAPKRVDLIAERVFEHCLWYFIREGGAPNISIFDEDNNVKLDDVYKNHMHTYADNDTIAIKNHTFELTHVKLHSLSKRNHSISFCADNRLVFEENITGKVPGLYEHIEDEKGDFIYTCYISSPFLNRTVRAERTGFDIPENTPSQSDELWESSEVGLLDIKEKVISKVSEYLKEYLSGNLELSKKRLYDFVSNTAPRYRPILSRIPTDQLNVDPKSSNKELDLFCHKHLYNLENEMLEEGHQIKDLSPSYDLENYRTRLQEYLDKVADIKKSDLASYVSHRKVIIDLFEKAIQKNPNGEYVCEALIHKLIYPMQTDSNSILSIGEGNLWLIDEQLAFHDYLASDKTINSYTITDSNDRRRPDIASLLTFDQPTLFAEESRPPLASIVVIEIKRPMRDDVKSGKGHDPIKQALGYLQKIRSGHVMTNTGRPIPNAKEIPGFCYVLADLTQDMDDSCRHMDLTHSADKLSYFGYHETYKSYIEVISFDGLLDKAKKRNRAFFDKLGIPAT